MITMSTPAGISVRMRASTSVVERSTKSKYAPGVSAARNELASSLRALFIALMNA